MIEHNTTIDTPNIVMVVLDDLGFADFGCYGSSISTPNVDILAQSGLRYNNFNVTAICHGTRACLLTGRNHHIALRRNESIYPGQAGGLKRSTGTIAKVLQMAGYNTFAVGKWHLTPLDEISPAGPFNRWPLGSGFDRFYGFLGGATDQWFPDLVMDNGFSPLESSSGSKYHLTEDLATHAIRFIQDQQSVEPSKPFFLYFATGAVHSPLQVPREWIEQYHGIFDEGWDIVRNENFHRQKRQGVVPSSAVLTDRPSWVSEWDRLSNEEKRIFGRMMEVYAGFLTHTDNEIGRLIEFLKKVECLDNTIIMVLSDNGASADGGPNGALDLRSCRDVPSMFRRIDDFGSPKSFAERAWGWAWASNTPFKLWKAYTWLGGVRVPLIIQWPNKINKADHGAVRQQFCHAVDLAPTVLDAAGIELPDILNGVVQKPFSGESVLPTLTDSGADSRNVQYFELGGSRAIYKNGWMATTDYVTKPTHRQFIPGSHGFKTDKWSLFNLDQDFAQAHDVSDKYPNRLSDMTDLWWLEAERNEVLPLDDEKMSGQRSMAGMVQTQVGLMQYTYLADGGAIRTPPLTQGFELVADIEIKDGQSLVEGVICSQGSAELGWRCYVINGKVNCAFASGGVVETAKSEVELREGQHEICVSYTPGEGQWSGRFAVTLDGGNLADGRAPERMSLPIAELFTAGEGRLSIGRDPFVPIVNDYETPFYFNGKISKVVLRVP